MWKIFHAKILLAFDNQSVQTHHFYHREHNQQNMCAHLRLILQNNVGKPQLAT